MWVPNNWNRVRPKRCCLYVGSIVLADCLVWPQWDRMHLVLQRLAVGQPGGYPVVAHLLMRRGGGMGEGVCDWDG